MRLSPQTASRWEYLSHSLLMGLAPVTSERWLNLKLGSLSPCPLSSTFNPRASTFLAEDSSQEEHSSPVVLPQLGLTGLQLPNHRAQCIPVWMWPHQHLRLECFWGAFLPGESSSPGAWFVGLVPSFKFPPGQEGVSAATQELWAPWMSLQLGCCPQEAGREAGPCLLFQLIPNLIPVPPGSPKPCAVKPLRRSCKNARLLVPSIPSIPRDLQLLFYQPDCADSRSPLCLWCSLFFNPFPAPVKYPGSELRLPRMEEAARLF